MQILPGHVKRGLHQVCFLKGKHFPSGNILLQFSCGVVHKPMKNDKSNNHDGTQ